MVSQVQWNQLEQLIFLLLCVSSEDHWLFEWVLEGGWEKGWEGEGKKELIAPVVQQSMFQQGIIL